MAFLLKAMGFGEAVPGFPFTANADATPYVLESSLVPWTLKAGKSDEDGKPVTIFTVPLASCTTPDTKAFARNALTLSKRLRLPGVLRCYGGTEYSDTVYLAMEPCEPLVSVLANPSRRSEYYGRGQEATTTTTTTGTAGEQPSSSAASGASGAKELFEEGVAMGLKTVGSAITALHQNDMFHGNVCADSVFVSESGFWRLWGFELTSPCGSAASFARVGARYVAPCRAPRSLVDQLAASSGGANPRMLDSYGMGCLVYEALVLTRPGSPQNLSARRTLQLPDVCQGANMLPASLQPSFRQLTEANARTQSTVTQFLANCSFITDSDYVQSMEELEELALWDQSRRDRFMDQLAKDIPHFPRKACVSVFLSKLMDSVRMGTASACVVAPIAAIAQRVPDEAEFNATVTPALVTLFASPDRMTRFRLLQHMDAFAPHIAAKPLNEQIWPLFIKGFANPAANIREFTARALVPLAPRLSAHVMTNDVPRLLQGLQQDNDGTIRANATICLCLVADHIPPGNHQRAKILVVGFGRMLKDAFFPSRMAALNSLHAILDQVPPKIMADMVVPGVAPVTMDAEAEARQTALSILHKGLKVLEDHHAKAAAAAPPLTAQQQQQQQEEQKRREQQGGSAGWGFGLWTSAAPATPEASAASSPRHSDPVKALHNPTDFPGHAAAPRASASVGKSAAPAKTPATAPVPAKATGRKSGWSDEDEEGDGVGAVMAKTAAITTPSTAAGAPAPAKVSSGWSDDDDDEDGWGAAPPAPVSRPTVAPRSHASAPSTTLGTASSGMSLSGGNGAAKPVARRKVGGGLGAARLD